MAHYGHKPSAVVTFGFQEAGLAPIRLSGRFPATNLSPALARPGQERSVTVTFQLRIDVARLC